MTDGLQGKVALVTGGASGIGAATAAQLSADGATVVIADIHGEPAVDVTDEQAVNGLVEHIVGQHGRLDIAANVAGTSGVYANVADIATDTWAHTMRVNLDAVFYCLRAELGAMRSLGNGGSIVNVASSAGKMGVPGLAAYSASKAAVHHLTRNLAKHLAKDNINVNAIAPGPFETKMLAQSVQVIDLGFNSDLVCRNIGR